MRICIEGNIGAGKSRLLDALSPGGSHEIPGATVHKEPVEEWGDMLELFYKDPATWALPFSLRVLLGFVLDHDADRDVAIVERSPLACHHVFAQLLFNEGKMSHLEWDLFRDYCDALGWTPDAIVFVETPVDACMDRVRERGRASEASVDVDYLKRVEFQYETMLKYAPCPIVRIDGTQSPEDVAAAARAEIIALMA